MGCPYGMSVLFTYIFKKKSNRCRIMNLFLQSKSFWCPLNHYIQVLWVHFLYTTICSLKELCYEIYQNSNGKSCHQFKLGEILK